MPLRQLVDLPIKLLDDIHNHSYTQLKDKISSAKEALELLVKYVLELFLLVPTSGCESLKCGCALLFASFNVATRFILQGLRPCRSFMERFVTLCRLSLSPSSEGGGKWLLFSW